MGFSSSKQKTVENGTKTDTSTVTPNLPPNLQTGLTGYVDKVNGLAGLNPYDMVAGPSQLQQQAFQGAANLGSGPGVNWNGAPQTGGQMQAPYQSRLTATSGPMPREVMQRAVNPGPATPPQAGAENGLAAQMGLYPGAPSGTGGQMAPPAANSGWQGGIQRAADLAGQVAGSPANLASAYGYNAPQIGQAQLPGAVGANVPQIGQAPGYQALQGQAVTGDPSQVQNYNPTLYSGAALGDAHGYDPTLLQTPTLGPAAQVGPISLGQAQQAQGVNLGQAAQAAGVSVGQAQQAAAGSSQGYGYDAATNSNVPQAQAQQAQSVNAAGLLQNFQNPYTQQVVNATMADFDAKAAQQQAALKAQGAAAGAFAGSRFGIAQAQLLDDQGRSRSLQDANIRSSGFNTALGAALQQAGQDTGVSQTNAGLGTNVNLANAQNTLTNSMHNIDAINQAAGLGATNKTQSSIANAGNTTQASIANAQNSGENARAQAQLDASHNQFNAGETNKTAQAQGQLDSSNNQFNTNQFNQFMQQQGLVNADLGKFDVGEQNTQARTGAQIALQGAQGNQIATNQANQFGAAAGNTRDLAQAGFLQQAGLQSAEALTGASQYGANATNTLGLANLGNQQQTSLANLGAGNQALSDNAHLGSGYGLAQFGANADAASQFAGAQNNFGLAGYQGQLQQNIAQAGLNANASQFGASALNANGQFNAGQMDNQLGRQLQSANLYGSLASTYGGLQNQDLNTQASLGDMQRQIQQAQQYAPYTQAGLLGQFYGNATPMIGSTTNSNGTYNGTSFTKSTPSLLEVLMQMGQSAGNAVAAGAG